MGPLSITRIATTGKEANMLILELCKRPIGARALPRSGRLWN
jgi:hypothetical protein